MDLFTQFESPKALHRAAHQLFMEVLDPHIDTISEDDDARVFITFLLSYFHGMEAHPHDHELMIAAATDHAEQIGIMEKDCSKCPQKDDCEDSEARTCH